MCVGACLLQVLQAVFEPTLAMITTNFEDYPDHRLKFFSLLHAITNHCFKCLFAMNPAQVKLLIDSIVWAFRHTERNVAETGLLLLEVSYSLHGRGVCTAIPQGLSLVRWGVQPRASGYLFL